MNATLQAYFTNIFVVIGIYLLLLFLAELLGFFAFKFINHLFYSDEKSLENNSKLEKIEEKEQTIENGKISTKVITNHKKTEIINLSKVDRSWIKGVFERVFLSLCLINSIYPLLTVYGALKLGTRLGNSHQIKNDYFLIGNIVSILLAMLIYAMFFGFKKLISD